MEEKVNLFKEKKRQIIIGASILASVAAVILVITLVIPALRYHIADSAFNNGDYAKAVEIFTDLGDYRDSVNRIPISKYKLGESYIASQNYDSAIELFTALDGFEDSDERLAEAYYKKGSALLENNNYNDAYEALTNCTDYKDSKSKIIQIAKEFLKNKEYDKAAEAFSVSPAIQNQNYAKYAQAMSAFTGKDYAKAVEFFTAANGVENSADMLTEAYYLLGKEQFAEKKYSDAKFSLENGKQEADVPEMLMACNLMIAEDHYAKKEYSEAKNIYAALPENYEYEGVSVKARLDGLKIYSSIEHLVGSYKLSSARYEVRQTHNSTGIWHNWTNTDNGGWGLSIEATVNDDGSVRLKGKATGTRYTSYSSISSGVYSGSYSAPFDIVLTTSQMPTVLYDEDNITLKYLGGTNFALDYSEKDNSQDVYFTYTYTSNYRFTK